MLDIAKVLTISTSHIKKETAALLDDKSWDGGISVFEKGEFGWWIYIPSYYSGENIPQDLNDCILLARKHGCEWLCLDRDAEELDFLKTYEW